MIVVDASVVVAALLDSGPDGRWAESVLTSTPLVAPHLLGAEVVNIIRRSLRAGQISDASAGLAIADVQQLAVELVPFHLCVPRVWQLRDNLSAYDAWYVAAAELMGVGLATLDRRLATAPGVRCEVLLPG